jgi:PncC family amidohydrolase
MIINNQAIVGFSTVGDYFYKNKSMELFDLEKLAKVHAYMVKRNETIAVAESVTAGLLQTAISQAEFASEFYQGGITVYNLAQKYRHLKVEPIHAESVNCVSEKVTAEMALEVCELFNSQWGIGVTGYATPVPESKKKVFAFYAISHNKKIVAKGKLAPKKDEPFDMQVHYVRAVLDALVRRIG